LAPHLFRALLCLPATIARRGLRHFSLDPGTGSRAHTSFR
jgi:hypothetical protein